MPILETIAGKAAASIISKIGSWGISKLLKSDFTPYEKELSGIIHDTVYEYEKHFKINETNQIPFYTSQTLFDEFLKFRFTSKMSVQEVLNALQEDTRIIVPTEAELLKFFEIFNEKIAGSDKLRELNIESNYKDEIFNISIRLADTRDKILDSINDVKIQLGQQNLSNALLEEWSRQLDEVQKNLEQFKPHTALERLNNIEQRIRDAGLESVKTIFSRIYYMQAQCRSQMAGSGKAEEEASLVIKAYHLNTSNTDIKGSAAIGYYVLEEDEKAKKLAEELLDDDPLNILAWVVLCFLAGNDYKRFLETIPKSVKKKDLFKLHLYHWLIINKHIIRMVELDALGLGFEMVETEPIINNRNRHFYLLTATYFLNKFYEQGGQFSTVVDWPEVKDKPEFLYGSKLMGNIVSRVKGTEVEKQHNYYGFLYCYSLLVIDEDITHVDRMFYYFNETIDKPAELYIRMAQAYNNLNNDEGTKKAIQVLESYGGEKNELFALFTTLNYLFLNDNENAEKNFIAYLNYHELIDKNCLLNSINLISKNGLPFTPSIRAKLEEIAIIGKFSNDALQRILKLFLYQVGGTGFNSSEDFLAFTNDSRAVIDETEPDLAIHIVFAYAHLRQFAVALAYCKDKVDFSKPSELHKTYCKLLYETEGNKPELLQRLKGWRDAFELDHELVQLELYLLELQKDWREVINLSTTALLKWTKASLVVYHLFKGLYEVGDTEAIVKNAPILDTLQWKDENYGIIFSRALMKAGLKEKSLDILYRQASIKQNVRTRQYYITSTVEYPQELFADYERVEPGRFVVYTFNGQRNITEFTEENKDNFPQQLFLNKTTGESFSVRTPMTDVIQTGQVNRICNKYLALFEEIILDAANPLSGIKMQSLQFEGETSEEMLKTFIDSFGVQGSLEKDRTEAELEKYYNGTISFSEVVNSVFRKNFIDAYFVLSAKDGKLFKAISPAVSRNVTLTESTKFVLDFTSVCLFYQLSKELSIKFQKKFIASSLLRQDLAERLEAAKTSPGSEFSINVTADRVQPIFYPKDYKEKRVEHLKALLDWTDTYCTSEIVAERLNFIMQLKESEKNDIYLQQLVDNKLLTEREGYILLSNDPFYYRLFKSSTEDVISPLHYLDKFHPNESKSILDFLYLHNYAGVPVTETLLYDEALKMLAGQENRFGICLENLRYNWNPYPNHIIEAIRFIKSLYLSAVLTDDVRERIIFSVFINLKVGLPPKLLRLIPDMIANEFPILPIQALTTMEIFTKALSAN